jgi:hypothetical protein
MGIRFQFWDLKSEKSNSFISFLSETFTLIALCYTPGIFYCDHFFDAFSFSEVFSINNEFPFIYIFDLRSFLKKCFFVLIKKQSKSLENVLKVLKLIGKANLIQILRFQ